MAPIPIRGPNSCPPRFSAVRPRNTGTFADIRFLVYGAPFEPQGCLLLPSRGLIGRPPPCPSLPTDRAPIRIAFGARYCLSGPTPLNLFWRIRWRGRHFPVPCAAVTFGQRTRHAPVRAPCYRCAVLPLASGTPAARRQRVASGRRYGRQSDDLMVLRASFRDSADFDAGASL